MMRKVLLIAFVLFFSLNLSASAIRISPVDIYYPDLSILNPGDWDNQWGVEYPRIVEFKYNGTANGTLLATWEQAPPNGQAPVFPIYESINHGATWTHLTDVQDTAQGWGMRWNPHLYELPAAFAGMPAGTILMAGTSTPSDYSQISFKIYKSTDQGKTWSYVSTPLSQAWSGGHNIWEPHLLLYNGTLICFFSDESNPSYNQAIAHISSTDGVTWSTRSYDVALNNNWRPGMPIVTQMGNGNYIMTYEMVGDPDGAIAYFKTTADPTNWGDPSLTGTKIKAKDGTMIGGSPYVNYTPNFGPNGMLIISANGESIGDNVGGEYLVNYNNGSGAWYRMASPILFNTQYGWNKNRSGFSWSSAVSSDNLTLYTLSDPHYNETREKITFSAMELGIQSGQYYKINSSVSGKILTVSGTAQDAAVTLAADSDQTGQKFQFISAAGGYFKIANYNGGKLITMVNGNLVQETDVNGTNQLWQPQQSTTGEYTLVNQATGTALTLTDGTANNTLWAVMNATTASRYDVQYQVDIPRVVNAFGFNGRVELSWNTTFGATQYTVSRSTTSGGPYTQVATVSTHFWTDKTVTNGTAYYYVVSAANSVKTSPNSAEISATPTASVNELIPQTKIGSLGSNNNSGNTFENVFDHNWDTFFDAQDANGAWVGADLNGAYTVSTIRFAARFGESTRMVGGYFQGANKPDFSDGVTLYTINTAPPEGYTTVSITNTTQFKYLRYVAPNGGYGNISSMEFYGPVGTPPVQNGSVYTLVNPNANRVMDDPGNSNTAGTVLQIWDDVTTVAQKWQIISNGDGTYHLINPNSGAALEDQGYGTAPGSNVDIWQYVNIAPQKWQITYNGDGTYKFANVYNNLVMDVAGCGTTNGTNVQLWSDLNNPCQRFTIVPNTDGTYKLLNPNAQKAVDVQNAGTANGTNVWIYDNAPAQKWQANLQSDGTYVLTNPGLQMNADVKYAGTTNGTPVWLWTINNGIAQKWNIIPLGDGTFKLINPNANKALDVVGVGTANGTQLDIWDSVENLAQQWKLVKQY